MFWLKKVLGTLLMPLPLGLGLLTFGILLIAFGRRWRGWCALLLGWLVLGTASNHGISQALTASLQKTYPASVVPGTATPASAPAQPLAFVAVLGGGHGDNPSLPAGQQLSASARARLIEGIRIALLHPSATLIVSGPKNEPDNDYPAHSRILADAAVELGFPRDRIVELNTARDTAEETAALAQLAGRKTVALVTSAWHLSRAMQLAAAAGLNALPCPADYLGGREAIITARAWRSWSAEALQDSTRAWREYLGQFWAWSVRTLLGPPLPAPNQSPLDKTPSPGLSA
ncbi:MAG: YdcF family protein [Verrucomicrobia bacterium]|nr:YdcF family protein [Verrucomicrobiota bacterium]